MATEQEQTGNHDRTEKPDYNENGRQNASGNHSPGSGQESSASAKEDKKPVDPAKKRKRIFLIATIAVIVLVGLFIWWLISRNYESTDDAQVNGHINPISARVAGTVIGIAVEDNQQVKAGEPLVDLDPSDYQIALTQAKAGYDQALAQSTAERPNLPITVVSNATDESTGHAQVAAAQAALAAAQYNYDNASAKLLTSQANNARAQSDLARYAQLIAKQEVAQSEYDQYLATAKAQQATVEADKATLAAAAQTIDQQRAQLREQQSRLNQTLKNAAGQIAIRNATIQSRQASAESSAAQAEQAKLNLAYTHIVSPVNGIVTERSAEVGAQVSAGQQLMMIVQTDDLWVTADFKETQLRKVRKGQSVRIHVDALDEDFDGYVEGMPAATGDRTSVLPPENATGNYVKVVQRLPVRIRFKPNQRDLNKLRPGMSVEPKIHLR
jgi:membrane fusion protein (multidrug efflux system)